MIASKPEEIKALLAVGFEYICEKMTFYTPENASKYENRVKLVN